LASSAGLTFLPKCVMLGEKNGVAPVQLEGFTAVSEILRSGVYALAYKGEVVYVGKSKAMLARVYTHRQVWAQKRKGNTPAWLNVKGILFDSIFVRPCHPDQIDALEREMINTYKPKHNELLKAPGPVTGSITLTINGRTISTSATKAVVGVERRV